MNRPEALEVIKHKAAQKYHGTALTLLSNLTRGCFGVSGFHHTSFRANTLLNRVGIKDRMLTIHLDKYQSDGIIEYERKDGKVNITKFDLASLASLTPASTTKTDLKKRATKAREVYAEKREARELAHFVMLHFETLASENESRYNAG
jgi:hypothetical protein